MSLEEAAEGGDGNVGLVVVEAQLGERLGDPCYAAFPGGGLVLEVDPAEGGSTLVRVAERSAGDEVEGGSVALDGLGGLLARDLGNVPVEQLDIGAYAVADRVGTPFVGREVLGAEGVPTHGHGLEEALAV